MSVSNSSESLANSWDVVVEPIAETDFAEPPSTSVVSESEVAAVAQQLAAVSLSRVGSADSFRSADAGPALCQHVDFRFYVVWLQARENPSQADHITYTYIQVGAFGICTRA